MTHSNFIRNSLSAVVSALALACSFAAGAAVTVLTDTPPLNVNTVKPNLMFTLDNSGSMQETSVPDAMNANTGRPCYKNSTANALYFDPAATYTPPKNYVGATDTTIDFPDIPFTAARWDGFNTNASWRNNIGAGWFTTTLPMDLRTNFRADYEYLSTHQATDARQGAYYTVYSPTAPYTATKPAAAVPGECHDDNAYTRVDVTAASAAIQQKFANWFSYYRSRMLAMKTAAGIAFSDLNKDEYRVGFHTINGFAANYLNVVDFTGAARQAWYTRFYTITPSGGTPSRAAHIRIGEYFRGNGVAAGLPAAVDPIIQSCQANYHLLSTDGYWNEGDPTFTPGNQDSVVPALPAPVTGLTTGAAWPRLYREDSAAATGSQIKVPTLSDIATYYWATDLKPSLTNNVQTTDSDPANWQHLKLFGLSIAARGTLPYSYSNKSITNQTIIDLGDPPPVTIPPTPYNAKVWPNPTNNTTTAIDDLWHATVNSRGEFFNVDNAQQLASALAEALALIGGGSGTGTGAALGDANLGASGADSLIYVPGYTAGLWTGEIIAKRLDPDTAAVIDERVWLHSKILDSQTAATGWDTGRKILTMAGSGNVVPFRLGSLTAAQKIALGSPLVVAPQIVSEQQAVLNYLRGDATNEDQSALTSFKFRARKSRLGDIINSDPAAVTNPIELYSDTFNPGYQTFKTANAARTPMVYFGANDGLFHAVNGQASGADAGKEVWSYMPSFLFRNDATGVIGLTYKPTDLAPKKFTHRFYVDGSTITRDVDFARTSQVPGTPTPSPTPATTKDWRTVLITGLGKGGNGYVAFDVTTPPSTTAPEATLVSAGTVLWEFTDPDMGFSYGKPIIVKTRRYGWVAILSSGYNNITGPNAGKGVVFVVDIKTGKLLHKFITTDGDAGTPIGLANLEVFVPDVTDFTGTEIYGGDLLGNVWRFDITADSAPASTYPTSGVKFAQLRDSSNTPQPITTYPIPYTDPVTGTRFVAVGTGKLLNTADLTDSQRQTFYNFRDGSVFVPKTTGLPLARGNLTEITRSTVATDVSSSVNGWYQELVAPASNQPAERIIKAPYAALGTLLVFTITPTNDVCSPGAFGTAYGRNGLSGNSIIDPVGGQSFLGGTVGSDPYVGATLVSNKVGSPKLLFTTSKGKVGTLSPELPSGFKGTVVNYREIIE
jgi:type IV pilus assembly protein PilY1